jgi:choline dehydrogenase-like flavoprotein
VTGPEQKYADRIFDRVARKGLLRDEADYVVVGTGPSGATAAHVLSSAGCDVIMIEEGRWADTDDFTGRAFDTQKKFYRDMGTLAAVGKSVLPIVQGRCVGGGSVINAAIIWRLPEDVFDKWHELHRVGNAVSWPEMERAFDTIEADLNVKPVSPDSLGRNNALLKEGADRLGLESRIIPRNERGCQGRAECLTGCPIGAKQSTDLTYVPWTLERGARLYCSCRANHIDVVRGRARTVHAQFRDPLTGERRGRLAAHARRGIVVCASPVQTPLLLWRSGIGMSSGRLGRHFMGHPGAGLVCLYPDEVRIWEGATQGWDSEHFRKSDHVKFEAISMPPDLLAVRLPGSGAELKRAMADFGRLGSVACAVIAEAEGRVMPLGEGAVVFYGMTKNDVSRLRKGLRILAEIMFAAGAEAVFPGVHGLPPRLSKDELDKLDEAPLDPRCYTGVMTHLFSTARMGPDPKDSVVGLDFQVHDTRGVYVLDSSIFPTNIGVNPQHTIMAIAMAGARRMATR